MSRKNKVLLLLLIAVVPTGTILFFPPVSQEPAFHDFADGRELFSIPNFCNVSSNVLFLVIGSLGMFTMLYLRDKRTPDPSAPASLCFFAGIFLTGLGSSYYHLHPDNQTLVWDRAPMTITFMSFFSLVLTEYLGPGWSKPALLILVPVGLLTVFYWQITEQAGHGDLRFYALVQFLPMVLIPLILVLFREHSHWSPYYWSIVAVYALAKILEHFDEALFTATGLISGHSLKHLAASAAPLIYFIKLWKQKVKPGNT